MARLKGKITTKKGMITGNLTTKISVDRGLEGTVTPIALAQICSMSSTQSIYERRNALNNLTVLPNSYTRNNYELCNPALQTRYLLSDC